MALQKRRSTHLLVDLVVVELLHPEMFSFQEINDDSFQSCYWDPPILLFIKYSHRLGNILFSKGMR